MILFVDNNLSIDAVRALQALSLAIVHLRDELPEDAPDDKWFDHCSRKGYAALTRDRDLLNKPTLYAALVKADITIFFIPRKMATMNPRQQTVWLLKAWDHLEAACSRARRGRRMFRVQENGKTEPYV